MSTSAGYFSKRTFIGVRKAIEPNSLGDHFVRVLGGRNVNLTDRGKRAGLTSEETYNFIHNTRYPTEARWNEIRAGLVKTQEWTKDGAGDALDQAMQQHFAAQNQIREKTESTSAQKAAAAAKESLDYWRTVASSFMRQYAKRKRRTPESLAARSPEHSPLKDPDLWKKMIAQNDPAVPTARYADGAEEICRQDKLKGNLQELDSYQRAQRAITHLRKLDIPAPRPASSSSAPSRQAQTASIPSPG